MTPTSMILGGDSTEIDWFTGYVPPPENHRARLEKVLRGEATYRSLMAAYAKDPKSVATAFALARKWAERDDRVQAAKLYREVVALDPDGTAGTFTGGAGATSGGAGWKETAPYADFARFELAFGAAYPTEGKGDPAPFKQFIARYPTSSLVRRAYPALSDYYRTSGTSEEAGAFFDEYASHFPDAPPPLLDWLERIVRDKGPLDKGAEVAARLQEATSYAPSPRVNLTMARFYDLAGDKAKLGDVYGNAFMEGRVESLARSLVSYAAYWIEKKENLESALAMADLALKIGPDDWYFRRDLATAYLKAGDDARALTALGQAWLEGRGKGRSVRDLWWYAGFWQGQNKNLESALAAARKAVDEEPRNHMAWKWFSDFLSAVGDRDEAVKAMEKAVALAPADQKPALQKKLDALKGGQPEKK